MRKNNFFNNISLNFHNYKMSYTMLLWILSAVLGVVGNILGMLYLVLSGLPIIAWAILFFNERKEYDNKL
ncbi:MAG: hypothetical protein ACREVX_16010 [Clostridium sp.]|uniref:hypothetical protein n=1 Tax=Clostridium sp. TaxID=1506 RepID=UPI003D6D14E4